MTRFRHEKYLINCNIIYSLSFSTLWLLLRRDTKILCPNLISLIKLLNGGIKLWFLCIVAFNVYLIKIHISILWRRKIYCLILLKCVSSFWKCLNSHFCRLLFQWQKSAEFRYVQQSLLHYVSLAASILFEKDKFVSYFRFSCLCLRNCLEFVWVLQEFWINLDKQLYFIFFSLSNNITHHHKWN